MTAFGASDCVDLIKVGALSGVNTVVFSAASVAFVTPSCVLKANCAGRTIGCAVVFIDGRVDIDAVEEIDGVVDVVVTDVIPRPFEPAKMVFPPLTFADVTFGFVRIVVDDGFATTGVECFNAVVFAGVAEINFQI